MSSVPARQSSGGGACAAGAPACQSEIAIGNIVGSNIFNILGILGVTAVISPIPVADRFLGFDLPIMIAVSLVFTVFLVTRPSIGRLAGGLMLAGYVAYVISAQG